METPKISIIVPIYKVEPYIRKCLDSICKQTHQNLEIILVDDGSPDNCGVICDEYAANDGRICVIHKSNGGVSSARNTGLAEATGEWIGWVDPDDWVEVDMFAYLLGGAMHSGADVVVCGRYVEGKAEQGRRTWPSDQLLDREEALSKLLKNEIMQNFLWDKLWKRELFEGVCFPEGRTYEDIAILHRLFERAKSVYCMHEVKYHYLQREDSIVVNSSLKNRVSYYLAARQRYLEMKDMWPQFRQKLEAQCVASSISIWCAYIQYPKKERQRYWEQILEIAAFAKEHHQSALESLDLGLAGRFVARLVPYASWWSFWLARLVSRLYKLKHGRAL